ncbi:MAG: trigger factor, partial [Planctomycetota bacterium]
PNGPIPVTPAREPHFDPMDVQVTQVGPCRRTLTIKVPPETLKGHIDRAFQSASRQVRMKGFRPGQVPRKLLEKRYGEAIRVEAKESIVQSSFREAVTTHELKVVGSPQIDGIDASPVDETSTLEFSVHLDVHPEFALGEIRGFEITAESTEVTDADVDAALQQLAGQKKTLDSVDAPIEENDFVKADLVYRDAEDNEIHRRDGAQLNANIPIAGTDAETFKATLLGKQKGESFRLDLTFPDTFDVEATRGQSGSVEATLQDVQRVQAAAIDDDLAKGFEFDDLEALKNELRQRIGDEKTRAEKVRQEGTILEHLLETHSFDLPESMVEDQTKVGLAQFRQRLQSAKVAETEIEEKVEGAKEEAQKDAERRVRMFFIFQAIAQQESITITNEDMQAEIVGIAQQHGANPQEVFNYYKENNLLGDVQLGVLERKVRDFLRENAKITDKPAGAE